MEAEKPDRKIRSSLGGWGDTSGHIRDVVLRYNCEGFCLEFEGQWQCDSKNRTILTF